MNQPHKARLIDMFLEEGRIWENVIIVAKQVDPIMIADFDGDHCENLDSNNSLFRAIVLSMCWNKIVSHCLLHQFFCLCYCELFSTSKKASILIIFTNWRAARLHIEH